MLRERASVERALEELLEMRVWQWVFRREKMRGSPQENVKALSKMWNTKQLWQVAKIGCARVRRRVTLGAS